MRDAANIPNGTENAPNRPAGARNGWLAGWPGRKKRLIFRKPPCGEIARFQVFHKGQANCYP